MTEGLGNRPPFPMRFIDPQQLTTPDEVFAVIDRALTYMRLLAVSLTEADMRDPAGLRRFAAHVDWLKTHYERLEAMLIEAQR